MAFNEKIKSGIFIAVEAVLYIIFICMDLFTGCSSVAIKYFSIILCLIFSFCLLIKERRPDNILVTTALVGTSVADLFLLVLNDHYLTGVSVFLIVQILYALRLIRFDRLHPYIVGARLLLPLMIIISLSITTDLIAPLTAVTVLYYSNLLINAFEAWYIRKGHDRMFIFAVGLTLFACCDLCVGLHNMVDFGIDLPGAITKIGDYGMWIFYLPAIVLITLSQLRSIENE